jgi:peptidoglycan/LPS O-acetylase OafA/YrhL
MRRRNMVSRTCGPAVPAERHPLVADIQILRAVAIIFVMIQHSYFNLVFHAAWLSALLRHAPLWCGVDLFFVISGYLIAGGLRRAFAGGAAPLVLRRFWVRRAFRLWPAAWAWLAVMVAGSLVLKHPPVFATPVLNLKGAAAGVFAYANFRFAALPFMPYGPSYPYWSLSLEEQFYVLLPLVMLVCGRFLPWVMAVAIVAQLPLAHGRLYMFLRSDGLLWGVVLACCADRSWFMKLRPAMIDKVPLAGWGVLAAGLAVMVSASPVNDVAPPFAVGIIAAAAALLVWLAAGDRDLFDPGWPLRRPLLWVGSRSYALYLAHVPCFILASDISHQIGGPDAVFGDRIDLRSVVICAPLLAGAVEATYRCVEVPLRQFGSRLAMRDTLAATAA